MKLSLVVAAAFGLLACGGAKTDARFPARPSGCPVEIFHGAPSVPTENIGPVQAVCEERIAEEECLRTLQDEACALGADVIWEVSEKPTPLEGGRLRWSGRAAHTKTGAKKP